MMTVAKMIKKTRTEANMTQEFIERGRENLLYGK